MASSFIKTNSTKSSGQAWKDGPSQFPSMQDLVPGFPSNINLFSIGPPERVYLRERTSPARRKGQVIY